MTSSNSSSKKLVRDRRSIHRSRNNQIAHKYEIEQGESVDYEVDYEQEAKQLVRTAENDFVRK